MDYVDPQVVSGHKCNRTNSREFVLKNRGCDQCGGRRFYPSLRISDEDVKRLVEQGIDFDGPGFTDDNKWMPGDA
jgi:hypothetical protein